MKYPFNIYPALFILSSNQKDEQLECSIDSIGAEKARYDAEELKHFPGQPQTYFGNCMVGTNQGLVTLHFMNKDTKCCPVLELTDAMLNTLKQEPLKESKYTFSYIAVNN